MTLNYYELHIYGVKKLEEDFVSSFLFDLGAGGVSENLNFIQTAENFDPRILEKEETDLIAYFESSVNLDSLLALSAYCQSYELKTESHKDWLEEWKKGYEAFKIVSDFWVVPCWIDIELPKDKKILINPGLAFGTGTHATTQLMAKMIFEDIQREGSKKYKEFLDLGAGTGILSILASHLGIKTGVATEIDSMAREKCLENFELNDLSQIEVDDENFLLKNQKKFPLVLANIIDGVLINLKDNIYNSFDQTLIVSGILDERNEKFKKEFIESLNLKIKKSYHLETWWGYVLQKT